MPSSGVARFLVTVDGSSHPRGYGCAMLSRVYAVRMVILTPEAIFGGHHPHRVEK